MGATGFKTIAGVYDIVTVSKQPAQNFEYACYDDIFEAHKQMVEF